MGKKELREQIFKTTPLLREKTIFRGAEIEIMQPTVAQVLELGEITDPKTRLLKLLCSYAVVPGSDERVFEDADLEQLMALPFSSEMANIQVTVGRLTWGSGLEEAKKPSSET